MQTKQKTQKPRLALLTTTFVKGNKKKIASLPPESIRIQYLHKIIFYHFKKLLYYLYHIILQHTQHPNFYFPILLIKIIYLPNKIIYPKTISILSHLSLLSNFYLSSIETKPLPLSKKAKKKKKKTTCKNPIQIKPDAKNLNPPFQHWSLYSQQCLMPISLPTPNSDLHTHFQRRYQSNPPPHNPRQTQTKPTSTPVSPFQRRSLYSWQRPTPISTLTSNADINQTYFHATHSPALISMPPHWSATRERREIMSGWWLAMAGNSGLSHGVVAMEFWVWREEVSEDWKERENQRLRDGERDVRQRVGEVRQGIK